MKNLFTLTVFVLLAGSLLSSRQAVAQAPDKMSYQAVIRDTEGNLVAGENVGMKISILRGNVDGTVVYTETQTLQTNANGLVTFEIGGEGATVESGAFEAINWSDGPYFIKTETDPSGGTDYTIIGTSQLLSVPYAFHAKTAETISESIVELDPVFEASPAAGIVAADLGNWDEAYLWGDHAEEGYLETETDPVFAESVASDITAGDTTKWNEAHGWGNHAEAGYLSEEADPLFTASVASDITQEDVESWDGKSEFDGEFSSLTGVPNSVIMPAGVINIFAGGIAPNGYLICDGRAVSRTEYADLFAVIGTTYGEGDGSTTFNLPDLQSRIPVGISAEPEFDQLGKTGGAKDHALTVDEMPIHSHDGLTGEAGEHDHGGNTGNSGSHSHVGQTSSAGDHSHSGSTNHTGAHWHSGTTGSSGYSGSTTIQQGIGANATVARAAGSHTHSFESSTTGNHSHSYFTNTTGIHSHSISMSPVADHFHSMTTDGSHEHPVSISESGGGIAHNNLQPYIVLNFIIKY